MRKSLPRTILVLALAAVFMRAKPGAAQAAPVEERTALSPAFAFQDAMVLQRERAVPIWGAAPAGTEVFVTFAGQRKSTRADDRGRWRIMLEPLAASYEPRDLTMTAGTETVRLRNVLVGEVWIAAGQSNMELGLAGEAHAKTELPRADLPSLRLLNLNYAGQNYSAKSFTKDVARQLTPERFYRGSWTACTPQSARGFSAVAYYFGQEIQARVNVPVGLIHLAVGGSPTEAWLRRETLQRDRELAALVTGDWLDNDQLGAWCRQRARENLDSVLQNKGDVPGDDLGPNHPFKPGFLWEAGIARLAPMAIRGVLWYQGESNSLTLPRVQQHDRLFPVLVADWRKQWGQGEFPFLYCQLSSIGTEKGYQAHYWPEFRDGQRRMLAEIPNSGLAVTSDLGHPSDVHPRNKREVGRRLAWWALARTYDVKLVYSGPLAKSVRREGAALVVSFDHADGGLTTVAGAPVRSFEIAGADGVFQPAVAELGASSVRLTSERVSNPQAVRYGWQPYSQGNLVNGDGLPASTFRLRVPQPQ